MNDETELIADVNGNSFLGYTPMFTLNGGMEDMPMRSCAAFLAPLR